MRPKILDLTLKLNRLAETDEKLDTSMIHVDPPERDVRGTLIINLNQKIQIENP